MKHIEYFNKDKYCLHDSVVSNIEFIDDKLVICFSEGFWGVK
jgi:hypothetical protein